jgi:hypothetical protein
MSVESMTNRSWSPGALNALNMSEMGSGSASSYTS